MQWLFWQVGGLGPMAGQLSHFVNYAPGGPPEHGYSHTRYKNEYDRLFAVMERDLRDKQYLAGAYSIADMAAWPWVVPYKHFGQSMDDYPNVRRWFDTIKARPAVQRGMNVGKELRRPAGPMSDEQRALMFGQTGKSIAEAARAKTDD
jgi:GST-like protein